MFTVYLGYLFIFLIVCFATLTSVYLVIATFSAAPFVPVPASKIKTMLKFANLNAGDTLIDLGSGDGRIVFAAAKSGASCIGIEINPLLYWFSQIKKFLRRTKNVYFTRSNLWDLDVTNANVITIYFIPSRMEKLKEKLQKEMRPGSRVVSYKFKFEGWIMEDAQGEVYLYRV